MISTRNVLRYAAVSLLIPLLTLSVAACGDDGSSTTTTGGTPTTAPPGSTTTTGAPTTSTLPASTSTSASTSTTVASGAPGDSTGAWAEVEIPGVDGRVAWVAASDDAVLVQSDTGAETVLSAYLFDSGEMVELPVESPQVSWIDIDGTLAVWAEGRYDDTAGSFVDQHVFAYRLPDGPKVDVAGEGHAPVYPQVAGGRISWVEMSPTPAASEETRQMRIFAVEIDSSGAPQGQAVELVPSAIASVIGDSVWTYSLSSTKLAWEQHLTADGIAAGSYLMDLGTREITRVGTEAWRPSLAGDVAVYSEDGLQKLDAAGDIVEIDAGGDFAAAASTFAAYFRPGDDGGYEIVARGFTGEYEQVLARATEPPWLASAISASDRHVAIVVGESARLFRWQPGQ